MRRTDTTGRDVFLNHPPIVIRTPIGNFNPERVLKPGPVP
jgi:hypothetical protein